MGVSDVHSTKRRVSADSTIRSGFIVPGSVSRTCPLHASLCRSAATCDACGSLRGGSGTVEIEPGNDALVAARQCFSLAEQGVAVDHLLYVDAANAVRAALANREAPLTLSFAAKTMPSVVHIVLNQPSVTTLYAPNCEAAAMGAL